MADKLVTIAEYMDSMQAEMAMQVLTDCGIKAILSGRHASDVYAGVMKVELQVLQSRAEEAKQILESNEQNFTPEELEELEEMDESDQMEEQQEQ